MLHDTTLYIEELVLQIVMNLVLQFVWYNYTYVMRIDVSYNIPVNCTCVQLLFVF